MKKKQLFMVFVLALVLVGTFGVPAAHAQGNKPLVTSQNQNNQGDDNNKPGWGYGDKNHHHIGPPGQSVRPEGDNDNDDQGQNNNSQSNHISSAQLKQFFSELQQLFAKYFG